MCDPFMNPSFSLPHVLGAVVFVLISIVGNFIVVVAQRIEKNTHEIWVVAEVILAT